MHSGVVRSMDESCDSPSCLPSAAWRAQPAQPSPGLILLHMGWYNRIACSWSS